MILRMEQQPTIDNLQNYPSEVVDQLKKLLLEGVSARQDPRRRNFYDAESADRAFFIHLSPLTGKVILLAVWRLLGSVFTGFEEVTEQRNWVPTWNAGLVGNPSPKATSDLSRW